MVTDKLSRVMRRCRAMSPGLETIPRKTLERAVIIECGYCPATYSNVKRALVKLGWIRTAGKRYKLTGKDLTEDY